MLLSILIRLAEVGGDQCTAGSAEHLFLLQAVSVGHRTNCKSWHLTSHPSCSSPFAHFRDRTPGTVGILIPLCPHLVTKQERNEAYVEMSGMLQQSEQKHLLTHCTMPQDFCSVETLLEKCGNQQHFTYHLQPSWNPGTNGVIVT